MWATIEGNLAIVSACLPTLRPIIRVFHGKRPQADTTTITHSQSNTAFSGRGYNQNFVKMDSDINMERLPAGKRSETGSGELAMPSHDGNDSTRGFVEEYRS